MRAAIAGMILFAAATPVRAEAGQLVKTDSQLDALDPGIKLFVREKKLEGTRATEDNTVLFIHGATFPSTPDFDLQYKDYSWADRLAAQGWVVYLFDKRNYGFSSREKALDEPAAANKPLSRSYQAVGSRKYLENNSARIALIICRPTQPGK